MTTGEKIRKIRKQVQMSQKDLARELFISRQAISRWERNEATPDTATITQLSEIFGVTADFLLKNEVSQVVQNPTIEPNASHAELLYKPKTAAAIATAEPPPNRADLPTSSENPKLRRKFAFGLIALGAVNFAIFDVFLALLLQGSDAGKWENFAVGSWSILFVLAGFAVLIFPKIIEKAKQSPHAKILYPLTNWLAVAAVIVGYLAVMLAFGAWEHIWVFVIPIFVLLEVLDEYLRRSGFENWRGKKSRKLLVYAIVGGLAVVLVAVAVPAFADERMAKLQISSFEISPTGKEYTMKNEENLLKSIKIIVNKSKSLDGTVVHECWEKLVEYKENGGSQQLAYETLHELYELYGTAGEEEKQDFVADILDIVLLGLSATGSG
ncbi:MAG: helix-turn-helix domain-containing protein [Defluviitaleaceae bacterium]|nr:helix-turn-helix domain-containing protein [Defluviitaleaceae bacterium]